MEFKLFKKIEVEIWFLFKKYKTQKQNNKNKMTDYKQLYEQMKEKQTTTFAMLMKVMEENEDLKEKNEENMKFQVEEVSLAHLVHYVNLEKKVAELEEANELLKLKLKEQ